MTNKEIKKELEKIYKERKRWNGAKSLFTKKIIQEREIILLKQQLLYRIENAKVLKDKTEEIFDTKIYNLLNYFKDIRDEIC